MKIKIPSYGLSLLVAAKRCVVGLTAGAALLSAMSSVQAADKKPNILILWGDDIGIWNISAYNQYKITFQEQRAHGAEAWQEDYSTLSIPKLYNLRADPFEEADHSADYWAWRVDHMFIMVPVQELIGNFMATFKEYPPSQKVGSWTK